jgi:aspartyl-tRNA synthetase
LRPPRENRYRTAWAGELRRDDVGQAPRVAGWVHRRRDHGGLIFIDLRDRSGLLQLVFHPETAPDAHAAAGRLRAEDVISAAGEVVDREEGTVNPNLPTGEIELSVSELEILADAETPPFEIADETKQVGEDTRLRYRYLDLRRLEMQRNVELRHRVAQTIRRYMNERDFLEIETPMMTRATPEGARDFIVPSRLQPGSFYALPQSPQLFKELFMIAGYERYYQIVRCFRDEDLRADRQLEFTQLDVELSFVEEEDVYELVDGLMAELLALVGVELELPLERLRYDDVMLRYGSDRPDRRLGREIHDLGEAFAGSEFQVFRGALESGGVVRGFKTAGDFPRKRLDDLTERARQFGAKGLVWAVVEGDGWRSPVAKFLSDEEMRSASAELGAGEGDVILAVADQPAVAARVLGELRQAVADEQPAGTDIFWVVDFPMFEWNDNERRWDALHHPFTSPSGDLDADPGTWRSRAYDVVMNGWELGGGSIRINRPDVQQKVFDAIGIGPEAARERFGFLLDAMTYGAPPLGGIAFGLDRIVALLAGSDSIREVIPFPKTATGAELLTGAPAPVDEHQLQELGIRVAATPSREAPPAKQQQ